MPPVPKSFGSVKLALVCLVTVLLGDQISKQLAENYLNNQSTLEIFPFFNLLLVRNTGISFGIFRNISPIFLICASMAVAVYLAVWARSNALYRLPVALVMGGAIGNILDRIFRGSVVDFLDFHACGYHWPAFNIADSSIVIGAMLLFFVAYKCDNESAAQ
ncbi:MAG: signal peptidase II [Holosporaceae bacterium]|jgi:signal peptidase II|nr:signal peptidase II [Holosporaceae bacterium]